MTSSSGATRHQRGALSAGQAHPSRGGTHRPTDGEGPIAGGRLHRGRPVQSAAWRTRAPPNLVAGSLTQTPPGRRTRPSTHVRRSRTRTLPSPEPGAAGCGTLTLQRPSDVGTGAGTRTACCWRRPPIADRIEAPSRSGSSNDGEVGAPAARTVHHQHDLEHRVVHPTKQPKRGLARQVEGLDRLRRDPGKAGFVRRHDLLGGRRPWRQRWCRPDQLDAAARPFGPEDQASGLQATRAPRALHRCRGRAGSGKPASAGAVPARGGGRATPRPSRGQVGLFQTRAKPTYCSSPVVATQYNSGSNAEASNVSSMKSSGSQRQPSVPRTS